MKRRVLIRFKPIFAVLGWSTSTAALTLSMIFNGQLLPKGLGGFVVSPSPLLLGAFYLGSFAICVLATVVIGDLSEAIISFFVSYLGASIITVVVLALPNLLGIFPYSDALQHAALIFTFDAFFPFVFLVNFAGTITGIYLAERQL